MRTILFLSILLLQFMQIHSQQVCADSSVHFRYSTSLTATHSLAIHKQIPTRDGGRIELGNFRSSAGNGFGAIICYAKNGSVKWSKKIISNPIVGYPAWESILEAPNGNIIVTTVLNDGKPPYFIVIISPDGNTMGQKRIGFANIRSLNNRPINSPLIIPKGTDSLLFVFWAHYEWPDGTKICMLTTNNSGTIGSSTILTAPISTSMHAPYFRNGKIENNKLFLYGTSLFAGQCEINTNPQPAFFGIEINLDTKLVQTKKAYCAPLKGSGKGYYEYPVDYLSGYHDNVFFQKNGNIVLTRSYLGLESTRTDTINRLFSISTFDATFNHLHSDYVVTGNIMREGTNQEIVVDSNGTKHLSLHDYENQTLYYALSDPDKRLFLQKKIPFASSRKDKYLSRKNFIEPGYLTGFNILSYQGNTVHMDKFKILEKDTKRECFGTDTSFLQFKQAHVSPINWQGEFTSEPGDLQTQTTNFFTADFPLSMDSVCIIRHICDTVIITSPDTICNITQPITFSVHKNSFCDEKINFQFDTSVVSSFAQLNDTTLSLSFKKPWKGYIYASPASCVSLKDSAYLVILPPGPGIDLGADSIFCPGRPITLNASGGFEQYKWQDGSNDSIFIAPRHGTYHVTAVDLCGRVYADTIRLNADNRILFAGNDTAICRTEKIALEATKGFNNYLWNPEYKIADPSGRIVEVFPEISTAYVVSAELFQGCTLKDTILVSVKECKQQFFIPNAFSPNKNLNNDHFKPLISGALKSYEFSIYDRWGKCIFVTRDKQQGWDGTFNGNELTSNFYIWMCKYQFTNQKPQMQKGAVFLVR